MPETRGVPSTIHGIPVPAGSDANAIPADLGAIVGSLEGGSILRRLDAAQIAALTPAQRPIGVTVHNLTLGCAQVWDGAAWVSYQIAPRYRAYSPEVRQGATVCTVSPASTARWVQIGAHVHVRAELGIVGAVSQVGLIAVSLPVPRSGSGALGSGSVVNGGGGSAVTCHAHVIGVSIAAPGSWAGFALESGAKVGDVACQPTYISFTATYEAA